MNIPRTNLDELIGKQFKRNKYGLSTWTDEVTFVGYRSRIINRTTRGVEIYVVGSISDRWYDLDEIVLVGQKLHWMEEAQLQKREMMSKTYNSSEELKTEMDRVQKEIKNSYGNSISQNKSDEGN